MPGKVIFKYEEPGEREVPENYALIDKRLIDKQGRRVGIIERVRVRPQSGEPHLILFLLNRGEVHGRVCTLQDTTETGEDLGLPHVISVTHYSKER